MEQRFAWATYASFSNERGSGGWKVGASLGLKPEEEQAFVSLAPTQMDTLEVVDEFMSSKGIEALPHRFAYQPSGTVSGATNGTALYLQSVPAGKDSTGRPGNVFSVGVIDRDATQPLSAGNPIERYDSPDFPTPFRASQVNAVKLDPSLNEPSPNPSGLVDTAWMIVGRVQQHVLYALQDSIAKKETLTVLVTDKLKSGHLLLTALSSTLPPQVCRQVLSFSTYERAQTLNVDKWLSEQAAVVMVPKADETLLKDPRISIIDPKTVSSDYAPGSLWSQITAKVYDSIEHAKSTADALHEHDRALEPRPSYGQQPVDLGRELANALRVINEKKKLDYLAEALAVVPPVVTNPADQFRDWAKQQQPVSEQPMNPAQPTNAGQPISPAQPMTPAQSPAPADQLSEANLQGVVNRWAFIRSLHDPEDVGELMTLGLRRCRGLHGPEDLRFWGTTTQARAFDLQSLRRLFKVLITLEGFFGGVPQDNAPAPQSLTPANPYASLEFKPVALHVLHLILDMQDQMREEVISPPSDLGREIYNLHIAPASVDPALINRAVRNLHAWLNSLQQDRTAAQNNPAQNNEAQTGGHVVIVIDLLQEIVDVHANQTPPPTPQLNGIRTF